MNEEIKPENMRIHSRADELIACLEGEIAKRDARIVELESAAESLIISRDYHHEQEIEYRRRWAGVTTGAHSIVIPERDAVIRKAVGMCNRIPGSTTWNAAEYAYDELVAILYAAPLSEAKAQDTVGEVVGWYRLDRPYEMTSYPSVCATWHKLGAPVAPLYAAPAAPAVDAGIVDMYRHLQKVTPYRFKKIQDASITDGGDVMYFHKDRFDAALLADMAAHCAAQGVV